MFSVSVDEEKNRMCVKLGIAQTGDGLKLYEEIKAGAARLTKGFSCISDISQFGFQDPNEAEWADKIIAYLVDAGMAKVIRVTGTDVKYRETREKLGYIVGLAKTIEDAEAILDQDGMIS